MSETAQNPADDSAAKIYCTQCGQPMRIAREYINATVACPHCQTPLEPWRALEVSPPLPPGPPQAAPAPSPVPGTPPERPYTGAPQPLDGHSSRSKVVAGVLGILLGGLGVHRFYLGYIGIGVLQIFVTFLGLYICIGPVGAVWGFVEGILCLTGNFRDVDGRPLRD